MIKLNTGEGTRPLSEKDIPQFLSNIRETDLKELEQTVKASSFLSPLALLRNMCQQERVWTLHDDNDLPVAVIAFHHHHHNSLRVSMLTTHAFPKMGFKFLKNAKALFKKETEGYEIVFTYSLMRDENHLKFLKFFGFKLYETHRINGQTLIHHIQTL